MSVKALIAGMSPSAANAVIVSVELPEGYRRVFRGALKPGDLFLNRVLALDGIISFEPAVSKPHYRTAQRFSLLIRPGSGEVDQACERCECEVRERGYRFCSQCIGIVLEQQAEARR